MTPSMVTAIAYLLSEVLLAGVSMKEILSGVDDTGRIDDELRARIRADQVSWEAAWEEKRASDTT